MPARCKPSTGVIAVPDGFLDAQRRFAQHLRDPQGSPAPEGIEERRLAIYRRLFVNNLRNLLGSTFKVTRSILGEARWDRLIRGFYRDHPCRTPYFLRLPAEFLGYLQEERAAAEDDPPFLLELAHYEAARLDLAIEERDPPPAGELPDGDLMDGVPLLSPLARLLAYRYPVHRLAPAFQPAEPPAAPTFIVIHRDPAGVVQFTEVNALTARLLELLGEELAPSGRAALERIAGELGLEPAAVLKQGAELLGQMQQVGILLGAR